MPPPVQHKIQDMGSANSNTNRGLEKTNGGDSKPHYYNIACQQ